MLKALLPENESRQEWVQLGRVSGVYGVKGWVRIFSYTEPRENILDYSPWYLKSCDPKSGDSKSGDPGPGDQWVKRELLQGKRHGKGVVALISGCENRDDAAELIDTEIAVPREKLPELQNDEFYWADLIGLNVVTLDGVELGTVTQLTATGANDVLLVKSDRERCIPYIRPDVVRRISLEDRLIEVDWDPEF